MADGLYRLQQAEAGPSSQQSFLRPFARPPSPPANRRLFNPDTPSPSRSPVNRSSAHNSFNMYNHGGHQGHNVMMNGGQHHQRYGMQIPKQGQHHSHQQHSHHQAQHNQGQQLGHHYNYSSGGLAGSTQHFTHGHHQNGGSEGVQDEPEDVLSEHWQEQAALADEARAAHSPHYYARHIARDQKGIAFSTNGATMEDNRMESRNRPVALPEPKRQDWMALDFGGQGLRALSDALFRYTFLERLYLNYNQLKELPPAIGSLRGLMHLDLSGNQLRTLPPEIGMLTNLRKLLITDNQIEQLPFELGFLYKLETLGVYGNPLLAEHVKSKIVDGGTKGLMEYLLEEKPTSQKPEPRQWVTVDEISASNQATDTFTAITYNILCHPYATKQQHGYAPQKVLNWETRKWNILNEIREYDSDIVCLQELDRWSYDEFFRSELSYNGYKSYYAQKTRADTMGDQAKFVDGCGTFWKEKKYICLDQQHFVFGRKAVARPGAKASADMLNRVWARDDIAVVTFLENRLTGSRVIVANMHLFWDPAYKDVKLIQVAVLMEELTKLAERYIKIPPCTNKQIFRFSDADESDAPPPTPGPSQSYDEGSQIPMVLCGDFNSTADSSVFDLLARGGISSRHSDLDDRNYGSFSADGVRHPFTLKSAYAGEMRFTNYTPGFVDVIDYIWYSSNTLRVQKLLAGVDERYLATVPGFPDEHFPSDHLPLKAEFAVSTKKKGNVVEADFGPGSSSRTRP